MARKRKLSSTPATEPDSQAIPDPEAPQEPRAGGMWAGSMMNLMQHRMEATQASLGEGILAGTVIIELDPSQIVDEVGSDRMTDWQADPAFLALRDNIERRGQTQPIRVRPANPAWTPSETHPLQTRDQFVIQSGRRRLAVCAQLGRPVQAIVSTEAGDAIQADLEERFAENTMRKALNGFEELISIGVLATGMRDLTQMEIAQRLGISQGDISLGLACLTYRDIIEQNVDIAATPKREYRALVPRIKRGEFPDHTPMEAEPEFKQKYDVRGVPMTARATAAGYAVTLPRTRVKEEHMEAMLVDLAKVVLKYQSK